MNPAAVKQMRDELYARREKLSSELKDERFMDFMRIDTAIGVLDDILCESKPTYEIWPPIPREGLYYWNGSQWRYLSGNMYNSLAEAQRPETAERTCWAYVKVAVHSRNCANL
jgi:hypothetical protein